MGQKQTYLPYSPYDKAMTIIEKTVTEKEKGFTQKGKTAQEAVFQVFTLNYLTNLYSILGLPLVPPSVPTPIDKNFSL